MNETMSCLRKPIYKLIVGFTFWLGLFPTAVGSADIENAEIYFLSPQKITQGAEIYLSSRLPWAEDSRELSIEYRGKGVKLPSGRVELEYSIQNKTIRPGRIPLLLEVKVNDALKKRLRLTAHATIFYDVVKAVRPVARGEVIVSEDVVLERISSSREPGKWANRLEDVLGFEASRSLKPGRNISLDSIKKPLVIKKGDRVILIVDNGLMKITAPGTAREKGYLNSLVKVTNLQTKKTVYGRVLDENTIEVQF